MERKINKEIREYREAMFWGLTLRQFFFSVLGTEGLTSAAISSSSILKSKKASYISEAAAFLASSVVGCGEEVFTFTGCFSLDALDCLFLLFLRNYVKFLGKSFRLSFYFRNFGGRNKNN